MVVLTAYVSLLPDKVGLALEACRTVRSASVTEPGCERYDFYQSTDDATQVVFVEEWTSKQHLDTHFAQPAFQAFFTEMQAYLTSPPEIRVFESSLLA